ncbi:MAG: CHAT domain-containing protein, partial [Bacteroidota bacterium]
IESLVILKHKAQSLRAVNKLQASKSTLQLAIQLIDQIRYNYLAEGSKYALLERAMSIYEQAIDLALEMDDETWAFEVAERSKATLLLESVKNAEAQTFAGISEELLEQEREQKVQIAFYERLLNEAESEADRVKYQRKLFDLKQNYQRFLAALEQAHPDYYALKYDVHYPTLSEVQQHLLNEQTALIEYFTGDSSIYVFVLTQEDFEVQKLAKTDDFGEQLNALRKILSTTNNSVNSFQNYSQKAFEIYEQYVSPALKNLPSTVNELILIPDGQLSYIPFQALIKHPLSHQKTSDPRFDTLSYLVYDYAISYAYSTTLLLDHQAVTESRQLKYGGFAPIFTDGEKIAAVRSGKLNALPHSRIEVEQIAALLRGTSYFEQQANLADFKTQAANFNILHLSTHAAVDDENPNQSRIHLFDDYITVNEIYNLPIRADLTVLSACETGVGEYKRGEGMLSLARAFRYAGCPSLVTSLWQVNDAATANLMVNFYTALKTGQAKSSALQQAQLQHLSDASMSSAHPFYWAAFVQTGSRSALVNPVGAWWKWGLGLLALLLVVAMWWKRR